MVLERSRIHSPFGGEGRGPAQEGEGVEILVDVSKNWRYNRGPWLQVPDFFNSAVNLLVPCYVYGNLYPELHCSMPNLQGTIQCLLPEELRLSRPSMVFLGINPPFEEPERVF